MSSVSRTPGPIPVDDRGEKIETSKEKLYRKLKEQPLVPIGSALTVVALVAASNALRKGNRTQFNQMLRYRVAAQGLTVVAAVVGTLYFSTPEKRTRSEAAKVAKEREELGERLDLAQKLQSEDDAAAARATQNRST